MNWTMPYPWRSRSESVRRINMSSEPGNESFFSALRPIPRILSLRRRDDQSQVRHAGTVWISTTGGSIKRFLMIIRRGRLIYSILFCVTLLGVVIFAQGQFGPNLLAGLVWRDVGPMRGGRSYGVAGNADQPDTF